MGLLPRTALHSDSEQYELTRLERELKQITNIVGFDVRYCLLYNYH